MPHSRDPPSSVRTLTNKRACLRIVALAPVSWVASGTPRALQIRWRLLPSLARSVGFGPVCAPQDQPERNCRPRLLSTNQFAHSEPANQARRRGRDPRYHAVASPVAFSNRFMPEPQPSSRGIVPKTCRCLRTKRIPAKQARSAGRGRSPLGLRDAGGSNG
jgi:hypothetical protein